MIMVTLACRVVILHDIEKANLRPNEVLLIQNSCTSEEAKVEEEDDIGVVRVTLVQCLAANNCTIGFQQEPDFPDRSKAFQRTGFNFQHQFYLPTAYRYRHSEVKLSKNSRAYCTAQKWMMIDSSLEYIGGESPLCHPRPSAVGFLRTIISQSFPLCRPGQI
jgi:K+ transporter